jgi:phosphatidylcholine synthase
METPIRPRLLDAAQAKDARSAARAWALHSFTGFGVVVGLFALTATFSGHPAAAVGWMLVAVIMDGLDGPIARSWGVAEACPEIDGCTLDTVVDYFNCVVVPVAFVWHFAMLPATLDLPVLAIMMFTSSLWYSRTDMMTADNWFNGFPAEWQLVVPTLFIVGAAAAACVGVLVALSISQLTRIKFVHPVRVAERRALTLALTLLWVVAIAVLVEMVPNLPPWGPVVLLVGPAYQIAITVRRTLADEPAA